MYSKFLVVSGYFRKDPLNITRTGGTLGDKLRKVEDKVKKLTIEEDFVKGFLGQLSLRDFILNNEEDSLPFLARAVCLIRPDSQLMARIQVGLPQDALAWSLEQNQIRISWVTCERRSPTGGAVSKTDWHLSHSEKLVTAQYIDLQTIYRDSQHQDPDDPSNHGVIFKLMYRRALRPWMKDTVLIARPLSW